MVVNHLELFAGIGGFRQALDLVCGDFGLESKNIGFSEIDPNATNTYKANFDTSDEVEIGDIVSFAHKRSNIRGLSDFNFLTGGFPCQSFSMMGKQNGFNDMRGNVFFQILEIIKIKKPKFILLENVKNILTHNKGETFKVVTESIKDLGYPYLYYDVFNSRDFSIAQNRNRVYIFATKSKLNDEFKFSSKDVSGCFNKISPHTSLVQSKYTFEILEKNVDKKYYLSEVIKPTILADGAKNFQSKSTIDQVIARPLTATMVKMHRACQDNYFSDDFIQSDDPGEYSKRVFTKDELIKKNIRKLTPKEAFLLQGFNTTFYENAKKKGTSDSQLYKQAGNAVTVNTVYAIFYYLLVENNIMGE